MYNTICNLGEFMELIINKSQELGKEVPFDFVIDIPDTLLSFTYHKALDRARVVGKYKILENDFVNLTMITTLPMKWYCDRCGDSFDKNLYFEFCGDISPIDTEDSYHYSDNSIDIVKIVEEQVVLHIPQKVLCKDDCKGICPKCGSNLNYTLCDCNKEIKHSNPFAEIRDKFN